MHFREDDPHDPMHFGLPEELQRDPPVKRGGSLVTYVVVVVLVVGGLVLLVGCARDQVNTTLSDFTLTPSERCQEARVAAADLTATDPDQETKWLALAALACAEARLGG